MRLSLYIEIGKYFFSLHQRKSEMESLNEKVFLVYNTTKVNKLSPSVYNTINITLHLFVGFYICTLVYSRYSTVTRLQSKLAFY
jgi:hypothetical protein